VVNIFAFRLIYLIKFNKNFLCKGDLAPLSHIVLGLIGEGKMWSPSTGVDEALKVLTRHSLKPLHLKPKEGLALINGTQLITALGAEAVSRLHNFNLFNPKILICKNVFCFIRLNEQSICVYKPMLYQL
jgi:hypothetical protein